MAYICNASATPVKGARYFPCTLIDEESGNKIKIEMKEPKLKVYRMFENLGDNSSIEDMLQIASKMLSSNKTDIEVTTEFLEDNLTLEDISQLFEDFTDWLSNTRMSDPN